MYFINYRIMNVNLRAPMFISQVKSYMYTRGESHTHVGECPCLPLQYVAQGMVERGDGGAIVNVSSVASQCALKDHLAYCE